MTNQTIIHNLENWKAIDNMLMMLAVDKEDLDLLIKPIYTCSKFDKQGFCESHITDNEAFAAQCDFYELVSLQELNDVATSLGRIFEGVLLINGGLCEYKQDKYTLLSENLVHDRYVNHLYYTCSTNVASFLAWMVDVHHYPTDGWIVENLKKYINDIDKLATFFNHFALTYDYDVDMLTQCSIDLINFYKAS